MKMSLKKLGLAVVVIGALGAIFASSAFAKIETVEAEWYTGTPTTTLTEDKAVTLSPASHLMDNGVTSTNATFKVTVGSTLYWLQATGVECEGCKITNGTTAAEKAMAKGKIKFTGVSVLAPAGCTTNSTVTTSEIFAHADYMHEGKAYVKFEPAKGPTTLFATVPITGCEALNTSLAVKGYVFGQALLNTGEASASQTITFNEAIHKTTESTLAVGTSTAILDAGATAQAGGVEFGVK
jgi:hypothetical protein